MEKHVLSEETHKKFLKFTKRLEILRNPILKECPSVDCEGYLRKPSSLADRQVLDRIPEYQ